MYKKYRGLITVLLVVAVLLYFNPGPEGTVPVEKIDIPSGIGVDLVKDESGQMTTMLSMSTYTFNNKDRIESKIVSGKGMTLPETRSARQLQSNHKMLIALQKVIIYSEDMCKSGIGDSLDILFSNEFMNNMGWAIVCKGKALDILQMKVDGYPSSSDYIDGMIENSKEYNFYTDNYKIMDMYVRVDAEGRSLVLPYLENINDKLQITGMALFKKDKMSRKIDIEDTRTLNILREDSVKGILELKEDLKSYTSVYGETKRKVSCKKISDKYSFTIDINFNGEIVNNTLIKDLVTEPESINKLEDTIKQQTEKQCQDFIDKMKNEYKIDCLELGRVACAKFGRNKETDWDEIVCNSDIKVNVKVKVTSSGRGSYTDSSDS